MLIKKLIRICKKSGIIMLHCLYVRTQVMVDRKGGEVK